MPNTLVHLGAGGLLRALGRPPPPFLWIATGCVLPDVPWILFNAARAVLSGPILYDVSAAITVLSTLACSLLAAGVFAQFTETPRRAFLWTAGAALLHLLMDPMEMKGDNGSLLLAPFSWRSLTLNWIWPEDAAVTLVTIVSGLWLLASLPRLLREPSGLRLPRGGRAWLAAGLVAAYGLAPALFWRGPWDADLHAMATLSSVAERTNKPLSYDRGYVHRDNGRDWLRSYAGEEIELRGVPVVLPPDGAQATLRGVFETPSLLRVTDFHLNRGAWRDGASVAGLAAFGLLWMTALWPRRQWRRLP